MSKWNVKIDLWDYVDNIDAENEQDAIRTALFKILDNPYDYMTDTNKIVDDLLSYLNNSCYAELQDEDTENEHN